MLAAVLSVPGYIACLIFNYFFSLKNLTVMKRHTEVPLFRLSRHVFFFLFFYFHVQFHMDGGKARESI